MQKKKLNIYLFIFTLFLTYLSFNAFAEESANNTLLNSPAYFWNTPPAILWTELKQSPLAHLQTAFHHATDTIQRGWLTLAIISKQENNNSRALANALLSWKKEFPGHPGNDLLPNNDALFSLINIKPPEHIALFLPLTGPLHNQGQAVRDGFLNAYYQSFNKNHTHETISFYDTNQSKDIHDLYQKAIADGAELIIGPLTKKAVIALSNKAHPSIPVLALNYTEQNPSTYFYEYGLSANDEISQMAHKAWQENAMHAIIIADKNNEGLATTKFLSEVWQSLGGTISDTYYFPQSTNYPADIAKLMHVDQKTDHEMMQQNNNKAILSEQRRQDFDVIFLLVKPQSARMIVPLLKYYYANHVPIYATSAINSGIIPLQKNTDLAGVRFPDMPWILNNDNTSQNLFLSRLYAVGLDAYLLSHELVRLTMLPSFPIYAYTGALTLNKNQAIYRHLPWTEIHAKSS